MIHLHTKVLKKVNKSLRNIIHLKVIIQIANIYLLLSLYQIKQTYTIFHLLITKNVQNRHFKKINHQNFRKQELISSNQKIIQKQIDFSILIVNIFDINHLINNQSLSFYLSILSPSFQQQHIFKLIQRNPTRHIIEDATIANISKVSSLLKSEISVNGITPAYMLNIPRPKQLYKNLKFLMTKPILHQIKRIISPDNPIYAGITNLRTMAFENFSSQLNPKLQQQIEKARNTSPTIILRNFNIYVSYDLLTFFLYLYDDFATSPQSS